MIPVVFLHGIGGGARCVRAADRELRGAPAISRSRSIFWATADARRSMR